MVFLSLAEATRILREEAVHAFATPQPLAAAIQAGPTSLSRHVQTHGAGETPLGYVKLSAQLATIAEKLQGLSDAEDEVPAAVQAGVERGIRIGTTEAKTNIVLSSLAVAIVAVTVAAFARLLW